MDSSPTLSHPHQSKLVRKQCESFNLAGKHPSSRWIPSFSSSSSSSSSIDQPVYSHDGSLLGPATPLRLISRIPFSWEHFPGIPKNPKENCKTNKKLESSPSLKVLPLPPPTTTRHEDHQTRTRKKNSAQGSVQRDPFFAALVECSKSYKEDHHHHQEDEDATTSSSFSDNNNEAKVSRSLSDRFGFVSLFASCKRTCAVSESLVHLPSPR